MRASAYGILLGMIKTFYNDSGGGCTLTILKTTDLYSSLGLPSGDVPKPGTRTWGHEPLVVPKEN